MGEIAIVTGYTGTAHVKSMHDRSRIAGMVGTGTYVLPVGEKLRAEMQDANTVRVLDGDIVLQGCHATIEAGTYQDLKIDNGTQGQKRHDLVVARYERRAQDPKTESVTLKIVKGAPAASPKDPGVVEGDILTGDLVSEVPLWRIPLDGLNVGEPVALFDVLMPMSELRDSVSQRTQINVFTGETIGGLTTAARAVPLNVPEGFEPAGVWMVQAWHWDVVFYGLSCNGDRLYVYAYNPSDVDMHLDCLVEVEFRPA